MKLKNWFALITALSTIGTMALAVPNSIPISKIAQPSTKTHNISEAFENSFSVDPYFGSIKGVSFNAGTFKSTKSGDFFAQGQIGYKELSGKIGDNQNEGMNISFMGGYSNRNNLNALISGDIWSGHYGQEGTRIINTPQLFERSDYSTNTNETKNFWGASVESIIKKYIKLFGQYGQNLNVIETKGSDLTDNQQISNQQTVENQNGFIVTTQENFETRTIVNTSTSLKDYYNNLNATLGIEGKFEKNKIGAENFSLWGRLNNQELKIEQEISQNLRQDNSGYVSVIIDDGTNVDTTIVPVSYSDVSDTAYNFSNETKNSDISLGFEQKFNIYGKSLNVSWDQTIGSKQKQVGLEATLPIYNLSEIGKYDGIIGKVGFNYSPQFTEFSIFGTQGLDWLKNWNPDIVLSQTKNNLEQELKYSSLLKKIDRNASLTEEQKKQLCENAKKSYLTGLGESGPTIDFGMSVGKKNEENFVKMGGGYNNEKYSIYGFIGTPKIGLEGIYHKKRTSISGSLEYDNRENSTTASVGVTYR